MSHNSNTTLYERYAELLPMMNGGDRQEAEKLIASNDLMGLYEFNQRVKGKIAKREACHHPAVVEADDEELECYACGAPMGSSRYNDE